MPDIHRDDAVPPAVAPSPDRPVVIYRHGWSTRLWHWVNALTLLIMLMSGLMIFNAHPRLYWGAYGANPDHAWLEIGAAHDRGYLKVGNFTIDTNGVLGRSKGASNRTFDVAFPSWATIPSDYNLALSRRWHFFFAWIFAAGVAYYGIWTIFSGHLRRDIAPKPRELTPRHIWHDIKSHALLRFPKGDAARHYNILQKLAYAGVIFGLLPLMVLTGLTMSPAMDAIWPWLLEVFGGRQTARSIHFITASLIVLFVLVHLAMVALAGPFNELRSMITGRYRLPKE